MTGWVRGLIRRWSHHTAYWDFPPHQVGIQIESSSRSSVLFFPSSKSLIRFCRNLERTFPSLGGWSLEPKPPKQPLVWCSCRPASTNARVESLILSRLQAKVEVEWSIRLALSLSLILRGSHRSHDVLRHTYDMLVLAWSGCWWSLISLNHDKEEDFVWIFTEKKIKWVGADWKWEVS